MSQLLSIKIIIILPKKLPEKNEKSKLEIIFPKEVASAPK